ncbi:hypothetical protein C8Q79DRAFT_341881 [Trametes meyenii]|nr:hypothetical protein C8Q79DRAFT_341881 [Trametes meyenii]
MARRSSITGSASFAHVEPGAHSRDRHDGDLDMVRTPESCGRPWYRAARVHSTGRYSRLMQRHKDRNHAKRSEYGDGRDGVPRYYPPRRDATTTIQSGTEDPEESTTAMSTALTSGEKSTDPHEFVGTKSLAQQDNDVDQHAKLSPDEERLMWRKVDTRLIPLITVMYLVSFVDKTNIGNAKLQGLASQLDLTGHRFNLVLTLNFIANCTFAVPSNLVLKKLRPSVWLPGITIIWGIITTLTDSRNY